MSKVKQMLKALGYLMKVRRTSYKDVASHLGVSVSTVKRIFGDKGDVSWDQLNEICDATGIEIDDVVELAKRGKAEIRIDLR